MTAAGLATAIVAFAGTTIDDLIILTALFIARRATGLPRATTIIAGQYAGFAAILALSLATALGLQIVPDRWVGLLGLIPIGLGARGLWQLRGSTPDTRPPPAGSAARIAAVTFANGADNISVFTPLFRSLHPIGGLLTAALFLALIGVWCAAAALLGGHHTVVTTLGRVAHWLVPSVFVAVGVLILVSTGTLGALVRLS